MSIRCRLLGHRYGPWVAERGTRPGVWHTWGVCLRCGQTDRVQADTVGLPIPETESEAADE